jgi:two-component system cell cycle response regulator
MLEHTVMVERGNNMSIMIIDIDYFKEVNDKYGHNMGDRVLVEVANTLKDAFRDVDIISRWGGDEFVALLPAADETTAFEIAENRIRKRIENIDVIPDGITVSIGVDCVHSDDDAHTAIGREDDMLYRAKEKGRNCVVSEHRTTY